VLSETAKDDIMACLALVEKHTGAPFAWDQTIYQPATRFTFNTISAPTTSQMPQNNSESESDQSNPEESKGEIDAEGHRKPDLAECSLHLVYPVDTADWIWCLARSYDTFSCVPV